MKKKSRLITNSWVAKPKKSATHMVFYETRAIKSKSRTKSSMCKEKRKQIISTQANGLSLQSQNSGPDSLPVLMPSCVKAQMRIYNPLRSCNAEENKGNREVEAATAGRCNAARDRRVYPNA